MDKKWAEWFHEACVVASAGDGYVDVTLAGITLEEFDEFMERAICPSVPSCEAGK